MEIMGWLVLDGKAVFVKCRQTSGNGLDGSKIFRVSVPRKYKFVYKTKRALSKSKVACLRRHIGELKQILRHQMGSLEVIQGQINGTNYQILSLKEQLKRTRK